jgi:hypothetical protein
VSWNQAAGNYTGKLPRPDSISSEVQASLMAALYQTINQRYVKPRLQVCSLLGLCTSVRQKMPNFVTEKTTKSASTTTDQPVGSVDIPCAF